MVDATPGLARKDDAHRQTIAAVDPTMVLRLLRERRSIRRYENRPVKRAVLEDILTCATWAPSAHNRQPWRFCVVTGDEAKRRLAYVMGERWTADLQSDGVAEEIVKQRVAISRIRMTGAAALVVAALCQNDMDVYPDERRQSAERTMAVQSVALACQNLLLAAHAHGVGGCWMCAPLFAPDVVQRALHLPQSWEPQAMITLGYPAEERDKTREPFESRVLWRE